jgi:hypothetical protein
MRDARGHGAALGKVIAQAQHRQRVPHAGKAHTNAALGHGLVALLRQRPEGHVQHVVERPYLQRHGLGKGLEIERGHTAETERVADKTGQDDGTQVAAAVGGQRLFAAVVNHQPIRVEGMDVGHRDVIDIFHTRSLQRLHGGREALAVESAAIARQPLLQPRSLVGIAKAHALGKLPEVVAADDQLMLRAGGVILYPAPPVGQLARRCRPALSVQRGDHAHAQQHALDGAQQFGVALREPHAEPFVLRALDGSVRIEQPAEQSLREG